MFLEQVVRYNCKSPGQREDAVTYVKLCNEQQSTYFAAVFFTERNSNKLC